MRIAEMESYVTTFRSTNTKPKETCRQCRYRKVRCDGRAGICSNCERLSFACSFAQASQEGEKTGDENGASSLEARPERRRASKACDACREQKVRCSSDTPQCLNCKRRRIECTYPSTSRRRARDPDRHHTGRDSEPAGSPAASSPPQLATPLSPHPSTGEAEEAQCIHNIEHNEPTEPGEAGSSTSVDFAHAASLQGGSDVLMVGSEPDTPAPTSPILVDYFFDVVYALPSYAFLYRPRTRQKWMNGTLDEALRLAISGVALSHQEAGRKTGTREHYLASQWIQRAEHMVWERLESPTVSRLQALMLVILYRIDVGQFQRAFMLLSLAARAATAMRLNHERSDQHSATLEVRRRLMWCLKLVERYFCIGLPEFELCPLENIYLRMPSCERDFAEGSAGVDKDGPGAYPLCIRLERLRRDIMRLTRSLALCEHPFPSLPSLVQEFEAELVAIGEQMEGGPTLTTEKLSCILHTQWLPRHILMHLSWHQCHCDIYRLFLYDYREAAPRVVLDALDPAHFHRAESLCFHHATSIIQILSNLNQQSTEPRLLEFDTAICAYQATRLVLFLSRTGKSGLVRATEEFALSRAELCLAALKRFFSHSILVKPIIEEMGRAIAAFPSPSSDEPEKLPEPYPRVGRKQEKTPQQQLSTAAKARQRLAIHSLLRQADFSDGDDDDAPVGLYPRTVEAINPGLGSTPVVNSPRPDFPKMQQQQQQQQQQQAGLGLGASSWTPPDSVLSEGSDSQTSPYTPYVALEWQDRDWLSKGFGPR